MELIKDRAYGAAGEAEQASVLAALATSAGHAAAPVRPVPALRHGGSLELVARRFRAPCRLAVAAVAVDGDTTPAGHRGTALGGIRKAKSEAKVKQRTEVLSATITASESLRSRS